MQTRITRLEDWHDWALEVKSKKELDAKTGEKAEITEFTQ